MTSGNVTDMVLTVKKLEGDDYIIRFNQEHLTITFIFKNSGWVMEKPFYNSKQLHLYVAYLRLTGLKFEIV